MDKLKTDCVTPTGRVSYPSVFEPKEQMTPGVMKYELTLLFSKKTDLSELKKILHNAVVNKWGPDKAKWPKFKHPAIKDGDEKQDQPAYKGCWYITPKANPDYRPTVVGPNKAAITAEDGTFYAGCNAWAYINAYAYDTNGSKGVTFGLNAVQKMSDGDRFDGRKSASDVFDSVEDGSDDESNYDEESDLGF